ncbi:Uncharacterised protein [Legionella busanensis]|uniref:Uncharacterized protein n=1 Tax=Legionella busanensis TaxID=190655 RepID=A0A378JPX7_9GAMM|nr:PIN domain-containing protein [Legionella busanensis]STX50182.1 Uncharacterised protein [Legionella busanensis]
MVKKYEIKIVFDTSGLHTKVAHDLFNKAIFELIQRESNRTDISLTWFFPRVVIQERQYQMQKVADDLLPSLDKIEILLGHKLNITSDILAHRVEETIVKQLKDSKIQVIELDHSIINLKTIIENACFRRLPFSKGKEEKGFRDAMIAESFFQLVNNSPKSSTSCKLVFFTNDTELKQYIENQLTGNKNIIVLSSVEEIEGLINTLASEIDEDTIKRYQDLAAAYFFNQEKKEGKYFSEKIQNKIENEFSSELNKCPEGLNIQRQNKIWLISTPQFIQKERTRLSWVSRIEVEFELYEYLSEKLGLLENSNKFDRLKDLSNSLFSIDKNIKILNQTGLFSGNLPSKKIISNGKSIFDVRWSVTLGAKNNYKNFVIDEINFIDTVFNE